MPANSFSTLLQIHIVKATDLKCADTIGKSDPYAKIVMGNNASIATPLNLSTRVIEDNLNPVWNEKLSFLMTEEVKSYKVEIFDQDVGGDDSIGYVNIARLPAPQRYSKNGGMYMLEKGKKGSQIELYILEVPLDQVENLVAAAQRGSMMPVQQGMQMPMPTMVVGQQPPMYR